MVENRGPVPAQYRKHKDVLSQTSQFQLGPERRATRYAVRRCIRMLVYLGRFKANSLHVHADRGEVLLASEIVEMQPGVSNTGMPGSYEEHRAEPIRAGLGHWTV